MHHGSIKLQSQAHSCTSCTDPRRHGHQPQCCACMVRDLELWPGVQAAMLARGRKVRQSKLLFYAKLAEKSLQTYERDGWGEFPTQINLDRREVLSMATSCWPNQATNVSS